MRISDWSSDVCSSDLVIIADRIIAGDIAGLASEAPRMDHAGLAGRRRPPGRPCCRRVRSQCGAIISRGVAGRSGEPSVGVTGAAETSPFLLSRDFPDAPAG